MRLSVRTHGPLDAQAMVLLHGLTSDGSSFDGVVGALAQKWRVYVPDQRGHGTTGPADAYAFELLAADLDEFLEERVLTAPVVVAHSMGAVAAYLHAARRPDRTGPLVLVEPPPPFPQRRPVPERPDEPLGYDWDARVALVGQVNSPDPGSVSLPRSAFPRWCSVAGRPALSRRIRCARWPTGCLAERSRRSRSVTASIERRLRPSWRP